MSDLHVVVAQIRQILDNFEGNEDRDLVERICRLATAVVEELKRRLDDLLTKNVAPAGLDRVIDVEFSKRLWLKHQKQYPRLLKEVRGYRAEIDKYVTLLCA